MHFRYFSSEQPFRSATCVYMCNDLCARSNASVDELYICKVKSRLFHYNYAKCHTGIPLEWSRKKHSHVSLSFSLVYAIFMYTYVFKRNVRLNWVGFAGQRVVDTSDKKTEKNVSRSGHLCEMC